MDEVQPGKRKRDDEDIKTDGMTPKEKRLFELRLKLNKCRKLNHEEVVEEDKRKSDPNYDRKKRREEYIAALKEKDQEAKEGDVKNTKPRTDEERLFAKHMGDTADAAEWRNRKKEKKETPFGWDVFNQDTLYGAHEKRIKRTEVRKEAYERQKREKDLYNQKESLDYGTDKPSDDAIKRMMAEMNAQAERKGKFSRRRQHYEDADVDYINDRNEHFNKKIKRAFDKYTVEIRQNLERGTAL